MMAIADAVAPTFDPILFTLSAALPVPINAGMTVEHLPSAGYLPVPTAEWHDLLEDRLLDLFAFYQPSLCLFDGVYPYRGVTSALHRARRRVTSVWVRRAMWRPGLGHAALKTKRYFNHVIEPGDYASGFDQGLTASDRLNVDQVRPIRYLDPSGQLTREDSCRVLGIEPDAVNVLVQLGAGQINDVDSLTGAVVDRVRRIEGVHVVIARSVLSASQPEQAAAVDSSLSIVEQFPISQCFAAFDAGVVAAGYNSFHEVMSLGLPSILVPNLNTRTDDQNARSLWAESAGMGLRWDGSDSDQLDIAISALLNTDTRGEMAHQMSTLTPACGAEDVTALLRRWVA
jgi:hypothetical protein